MDVKIGVKWVRAGQDLMDDKKGPRPGCSRLASGKIAPLRLVPQVQGEAGMLMDAAEFGHET